jgi:hypothetical protein
MPRDFSFCVVVGHLHIILDVCVTPISNVYQNSRSFHSILDCQKKRNIVKRIAKHYLFEYWDRSLSVTVVLAVRKVLKGRKKFL